MAYRIELHRKHEIMHPSGIPTQRAIMAINDVARSKKINVGVIVHVSPSANVNDDGAQKFVDGSWIFINRFIQPHGIPTEIVFLYGIIRNIEHAYEGLYGG